MPGLMLDIRANDQASGKLKGLVGSIFSAHTAMMAFRTAQRGVVEGYKLAVKYSEDFKAVNDGISKTMNGVKEILGKSIGDALANVLKGMTEGNDSTKEFAKTVTILASAFTIIIPAVGETIGIISNLVKLITRSADAIDKFYTALTGKESWDNVNKAFDKVGYSIEYIVQETGDSVKKIMAITNKEIADFNKNVDKNTSIILEGKKKKNKDEIAEEKKKNNELIKNIKDVDDAWKESVKKRDDESKLLKDKQKKDAENIKDSWKKAAQQIAQGFADAFGQVAGIVQQFYDGQISAEQAYLENQLALIDEDTQRQLEAAGLQDETRSETLEKEISELEDQAKKTTNSKKKKDLQDQILVKQNELKKAKILEDAEKAKEKASKESKKKQYQMEVDAFNANKGMQIAALWINYAVGMVGLWSQCFASMHPIPAAITAGIMTAILTGVAIAQSVMLGTQNPPPPPAFAEGGAGAFMAGERGRELVKFDVMNNTSTERLMSSMTPNVNVYVYLDSYQIPIAKILTENARFEGAR